jgi:hypothetical protein
MKTKLLKLALCAMALMPMGAWGEAKLIDINFAELAVETQGELCNFTAFQGSAATFGTQYAAFRYKTA